MSIRLPLDLATSPRPETGDAVLRHELLRESAVILGRLGREVESRVAALAAMNGDGDAARRAAAIHACADAVWRYFVQREVCGLVNHDAVIECYRIPREVLARVGATRPPMPT